MGREPSPLEEGADAAVIESSLVTPSAFSTIFDRHFDTVYAYLARRVGRDRAEDLAASTFTVAFECRRRFRAHADSARPWLLGIATNLLRNEWRAERRGSALMNRLRGAEGDPRRSDEGSGEELGALLAELDRDQLEVLLLYAWEELSYAEIAATLAIPVGTVRSRLARARARLQAGLARGETPGPRPQEARG